MTERVLIGPLADLVPCSTRRVEHGEHRIAVIRIDDDVYAIGDTCTHAEVSLSEGELDCEERTLECWKHGSAFSVVDGEPLSLPATRPTPVYAVAVDDGQVYVEID